MITERLKQAIQLIKEGKQDRARDLILAEVRHNPDDLTTWLWALEVAINEKEKRTILRKILSIDPTHKGALAYQRKLDEQAVNVDSPAQAQQKHLYDSSGSPSSEKKSLVAGLLSLVYDWASSLPSGCALLAVFVGIIVGVFIYTSVNTSLFGLAGTDFDELVVSNSYELISSNEHYWEVKFEGIGKSKYIGTVRYAGPIRIKEFAILTHDILVTTGDFSNPDIVSTNVIDHKFFWKSPDVSSPSGSINLIHAVPANKKIYQQLLEIQKWDTVKITGREILSIKAFQSDENFLGTWADLGCNTLLVESVTIIKGTEEN
jgi:hypothetical protein